MFFTVSNGWETFIQFFTVAVVFVIVLALTYVTTKWTAGFQKSRMRQTNMEVLETMKLTANKYVQIIRCGERYLAVAVCKDTVTLLAELDREELTGPDSPQQGPSKFQEILEKAKKVKPEKQAGNQYEEK